MRSSASWREAYASDAWQRVRWGELHHADLYRGEAREALVAQLRAMPPEWIEEVWISVEAQLVQLEASPESSPFRGWPRERAVMRLAGVMRAVDDALALGPAQLAEQPAQVLVAPPPYDVSEILAGLRRPRPGVAYEV